MRHKIAVICTHYNHIDIFPFIYDYWKRFAAHVYVFDNGSNDGSLEKFKEHEDYITVIDFSHRTGGKLCDSVNIDIKNNYWKEIKDDYDYILICDFDEALYCEDLDRILDICDEKKIDMIYPKYCDMCDDMLKPYTPGKLYHELNPYCVNKNVLRTCGVQYMDTKLWMINPKTVIDTNWDVGQHHNRARSINSTSARINNLYIFHLHYISLELAIKTYMKNKETMSDENRRKGWGIQYNTIDDLNRCTDRLANKIEYYNYTINNYIDY